MDSIFFPRKISSTFDNVHDKPHNVAPSPPSYHQATASTPPLLLEEMTTTTTEVVTTTTTQTVTHLFAFPPWRKRQNSHTPRPESRQNDDRPMIAVIPSGISLNEKALPPTPPGESNTEVYTPREARPGVIGISYSKSSPPTTTTAAMDYPHLGIGHPSASTSRLLSTNSKSRPSTSAGERTVMRHQAKPASENPTPYSPEITIAERQRGLSFGSASKKGKAREEPGDKSTVEPKRLVRKTSLWNRRKASQPTELLSSPSLSPEIPNTKPQENLITLPPLPLVHRTSPFESALFDEKKTNLQHHQQEPHQNCENHHPSQPPDEHPLPRRRARPSTAKTDEERPPAPRLRPQTSAPLLHRLSMAVFSHGPSEGHSPTSKPGLYTESPTQCAGSLPFPSTPLSRIPRPLDQEGESPDVYLARLKLSVNKADIASILAASPDVFHVNALRTYFNHFNFDDVPLDVALRKLLMEVSLPRETQQIDRVIEAFSLRYTQCNPELFTSQDHLYILAFSLIMLHTDAFNPSNKRKMTKADYIKNTKQPGIVTEVLDCFFDNIVFAPFIFIEDPVDFDGQTGMNPNLTNSSSHTPISAFPPSTAASTFKMTQKIDPYYLIVNNLLDPLRVDVNSYIALDNPFSYKGTDSTWDGEKLHRSFVHTDTIKLGFPVANGGPVCTSSFTPTTSDTSISPESHMRSAEMRCLKVAKMGLLNRKDDLLEGGKRSNNRKWRTWGVILTGSQLLFFRDSGVVLSVMHDMESSHITLPYLLNRPDEIFSVKDAIAAYDRSYTKYAHTTRLALMDGRQLLLQASGDQELDEWISRINYASAFRSAGIKMRPPGLSGEDIHLTGVAAATSHLHDMQQMANLSRPHSWGSDAPNDLMDMLSGQHLQRPPPSRSTTLDSQASECDVPVAPEIEGAEQFKATFDQVKADLMADDDTPADVHLSPQTTFVGETSCSSASSPLPRQKSIRKASSRAHIIQTKIHELETRIAAMEPRVSAHRMFIRNIAILTPFQKNTRLRLTVALQGMARQITQTRLDMEKFRCHLFILQNDLASETLAWEESKDVALRIAKETLRSRRSLPLMTLSPDKQSDGLIISPTDTTLSSSLNTPLSRKRAPSSCGSYHSAVDFGFDWSSAEDLFLSSSQHEAPTSNGSHTPAPRPSMVSTSSARSSTERQKTSPQEFDEEAEEWHRTRCAQRVSLVHVPSTFKVASWLKHDPPLHD